MANEYKLAYTGAEIDEKLSKIDNAVLNTSQSLTSDQKTQARTNIGAAGNTFSNIKVGSTTVAADSTADTLTLVAGSNITLTPDATNDTITIAASGGGSATDTNYYHTTGSWSGLTYTAQANGGAGELKFTIPTGTSSTTVSAGNHTHSSYVNKNAFGNITVGSTTIAADSTQDTLTLVAGTNITLTPDATNDKITISASGGSGSNYYHSPSYTSGLKIATGSGVNDLYVPTGTTSTTVALGNHTHSGYAPAYSYSSSDLDLDEDSLTTGKLYFVYE